MTLSPRTVDGSSILTIHCIADSIALSSPRALWEEVAQKAGGSPTCCRVVKCIRKRKVEKLDSNTVNDHDERAMTNRNDDAPQNVAEGLALIHIAAEWLLRQRQ